MNRIVTITALKRVEVEADTADEARDEAMRLWNAGAPSVRDAPDEVYAEGLPTDDEAAEANVARKYWKECCAECPRNVYRNKKARRTLVVAPDGNRGSYEDLLGDPVGGLLSGWKDFPTLFCGKDYDLDQVKEAYEKSKDGDCGDYFAFLVMGQSPAGTIIWLGTVGFYIIPKDALREKVGEPGRGQTLAEQAEEVAGGEVKDINSVMTGDVWMYAILDDVTGGEVDSCYGYIGGAEDIIKEAVAADSLADWEKL